MGPSGSGKSTLLNLAGGLDRPSQGEVVVDGTVLAGCSRRALAALRRRRVGYVFQDLNLLPSLTAAENVALPLELDGVRLRQARQLELAALTEVDLDGYGPRFPDEMSGGQQQRVAIARALVGQRRLVLADEPTGALDSQTGEAVLRLLRSKVDGGAAGVLVTHEARHAAWADRVVFLRDGDPAAVGALVGMAPEDAEPAAAALRAGAVVIDDPRYLDNGQVTLTIETGLSSETRTVTVPGFALPHRPRAPITLLTSQTARTLGLNSSTLVTLATTSQMPTTAEQAPPRGYGGRCR